MWRPQRSLYAITTVAVKPLEPDGRCSNGLTATVMMAYKWYDTKRHALHVWQMGYGYDMELGYGKRAANLKSTSWTWRDFCWWTSSSGSQVNASEPCWGPIVQLKMRSTTLCPPNDAYSIECEGYRYEIQALIIHQRIFKSNPRTASGSYMNA